MSKRNILFALLLVLFLAPVAHATAFDPASLGDAQQSCLETLGRALVSQVSNGALKVASVKVDTRDLVVIDGDTHHWNEKLSLTTREGCVFSIEDTADPLTVTPSVLDTCGEGCSTVTFAASLDAEIDLSACSWAPSLPRDTKLAASGSLDDIYVNFSDDFVFTQGNGVGATALFFSFSVQQQFDPLGNPIPGSQYDDLESKSAAGPAQALTNTTSGQAVMKTDAYAKCLKNAAKN